MLDKPKPAVEKATVPRGKPTRKKRKRKLSSNINMWIRRIHLFSGLFMLPWVLLYGFTALLFNHPKISMDPQTEIKNFTLIDESRDAMPSPFNLAHLAVESAQEKIKETEGTETIELAEPANAVFTRSVFGSTENDDATLTLIMDLNTGTGYLRKRYKTFEPEKEESPNPTIKAGFPVSITKDPVKKFTDSVTELVNETEFDISKLNVRSFPTIEFDAIVDGERQRMRYSRTTSRRPTSSANMNQSESKTEEQVKPEYRGNLSIVGSNPRDLNWRNYLLRLHMAHGYPVQKNHRWFWAIAVDLMFASMVFWGLSGVVMWWQIRRTRRIGMILLIGSAIVATWLAIGMHWELVNG